MRRCLRRGSPLGDESWVRTTARRLVLESTLHPHGRPKVRPDQKTQNNESCPLFSPFDYFVWKSRSSNNFNAVSKLPPSHFDPFLRRTR